VSERGRREKNEQPTERQLRVTNAESDFEASALSLSKAVLSPIAALVRNKRLLVIGDGALQAVPFAALPDLDDARVNGSPRPLLATHEIIILPSASVLVLQRRELANRQLAPKALAVIADPVFDQNDPRVTAAVVKNRSRLAAADTTTPRPAVANLQLSRSLEDVGLGSGGEIGRLFFSKQEAEAILRNAPRTQSFSALGFNANRRTVTSPSLAQYRIVHFATHGVMDLNHPELSAVLLSMVDKSGREQNGYLGLTDIYNLNLPAELVVLSACETGIGKEIKGEGMIALTRGFMYAGAARVVASLWKVDDSATAQLMAQFYKEMFANKAKPSEALRVAQLSIMMQPQFRKPHFWAGFILQGEWR
jgi:CHAT domain-containing protein